MSNTDPLPGSGWLPVDAMDDLAAQHGAVSQEITQRLLRMSPRARVLELMRLAAAGVDATERLRASDLARALEAFEGSEQVTDHELCHLFPNFVLK